MQADPGTELMGALSEERKDLQVSNYACGIFREKRRMENFKLLCCAL